MLHALSIKKIFKGKSEFDFTVGLNIYIVAEKQGQGFRATDNDKKKFEEDEKKILMDTFGDLNCQESTST